MKKVIGLFFILFSISLVAGNISFDFLTARTEGSSVIVEWKPSSENSVVKYEIERAIGKNSYSTIYTEYVKGPFTSYKFIDEDVYQKNKETGNIILKNEYFYRIKVVYLDNTYSYSNSVSALPNVSSVKRTWGMIKELFR